MLCVCMVRLSGVLRNGEGEVVTDGLRLIGEGQ